MIGVGVGFAGNVAVEASVNIFSVVERVGASYAGNGAFGASAVKLSAQSM